jgi:hypothetical protein
MTKANTLRALRIEFDKSASLYMVCAGSGMTYRAFGCAVSEKAAKSLRASIRRDPAAYGIV